MADVAALAARLARVSSRPGRDPYAGIDWPSARDDDAWYFSPELVSLHGTPAWDALDEPARRRLAFFEAVNFFSLNVHGEQRLIAGLDALTAGSAGGAITGYLRVFRAEEAKHQASFAQFCDRYAGGVYEDRAIALPNGWTGADAELVFFARVLVFEELVDRYNAAMARDRRLAPIAARINRAHHLEEARHLAFGRAWLAQLVASARARWDTSRDAAVRDHLRGFRTALWRDLFNPHAYADAGLADAHALRRAALADPQVAARERSLFRHVDRFFAGIGLAIDGVPA
jgi:hypothetical protein